LEIVYFSNYSGNTKRFVEKLEIKATQIPVKWNADSPLLVDKEYVLILPTYGAGRGTYAVPLSVIKFLNIPGNRDNAIAVIGTGNTNFGEHYCLAAEIISDKLKIPLLHRVEILGTQDDVEQVTERIQQLWSKKIATMN
jgi:protein involved in ribonucleotide reduction